MSTLLLLQNYFVPKQCQVNADNSFFLAHKILLEKTFNKMAVQNDFLKTVKVINIINIMQVDNNVMISLGCSMYILNKRYSKISWGI